MTEQRQEFNFVGNTVSQEDIELFLGPMEPEDGPFVTVGPEWSLAHVMNHVGLFPSVKQAKNNGWNKPIEAGYSEFTVGKKKTKVFILTAF